MRRYDENEEVDLVIAGAGAGGSVLAQRLARHGWRVVIIEAGPFWHPDEDWVSDEAGSHGLYWTQKRIIGGADPIELGKNNSGRGVGGSMVHYAGCTPRFHPSDLETFTRDEVGADWPIRYEDLRGHYCSREPARSCRCPLARRALHGSHQDSSQYVRRALAQVGSVRTKRWCPNRSISDRPPEREGST